MNRRAGQHEIWNLIQGVFDSFEERDVQGMEDLLHDDCTLWDVFEPELIEGREDREAFHERDKTQSMARGGLSITIDPLKLDVYDDVAVARYWLAFTYEPPNATSGRVRITDVLVRTPNGWRIVHHHEGMAPSGVPPITE
ncbi:MAG: nuclear transport factor 2 family protein [Gammaproteobacteria bacterium]|nr:nuclear transport factor 2 family protein [Gammaproteobacteria bacterium]MXW46061.1 nuclear transport factor 2 family protein [Gammaproteobacteria bacterium]MYD02725.1 nuclear transport factor 2 family protein [Gammaproteobacteria bacterium]MYI25862.1 nuclear transport factor 2 family protein [Gammaproteobacteria bacterium]